MAEEPKDALFYDIDGVGCVFEDPKHPKRIRAEIFWSNTVVNLKEAKREPAVWNAVLKYILQGRRIEKRVKFKWSARRRGRGREHIGQKECHAWYNGGSCNCSYADEERWETLSALPTNEDLRFWYLPKSKRKYYVKGIVAHFWKDKKPHFIVAWENSFEIFHRVRFPLKQKIKTGLRYNSLVYTITSKFLLEVEGPNPAQGEVQVVSRKEFALQLGSSGLLGAIH